MGVLQSVVLTACGYHLVGAGRLPPGITCVSVGRVSSQSVHPGLEAVFAVDLEDSLARRRLLCDGASRGGRLVGVIDALEMQPAALSVSGGSSPGVAAYRIDAVVHVWVEESAERVWDSGAVSVVGEMPATPTAPGEVGLARATGLRDTWTRMSREAAERVIGALSASL